MLVYGCDMQLYTGSGCVRMYMKECLKLYVIRFLVSKSFLVKKTERKQKIYQYNDVFRCFFTRFEVFLGVLNVKVTVFGNGTCENPCREGQERGYRCPTDPLQASNGYVTLSF